MSRRRYILSGGNTWRHHYDVPFKNLYGFELLYQMFDPKEWDGWYVRHEDIYKDPTLLDGIDLWILSMNYSDATMPGWLEAVEYAHRQGTIIGGEPNAGHHVNLLSPSPQVIETWKHVDFMFNPSIDPEVVAAFEHVYEMPYFGCPVPVDADMHLSEIAEADGHAIPLPDDIENWFIFGHGVTSSNFITIQLAERFEIPLIVNCYEPGWAPEFDCWVGGVDATVDAKQTGDGFKYVKFIRGLSHYQWLYELKHSRGIFYLTYHPSAGRPMMYANLCGKISLSTAAAWQTILYPEVVLHADFTAGMRWKEYAALAEALLPLATERLEGFTPERCQERFSEWWDCTRNHLTRKHP